MNRYTIGLLGGTFDPIHYGHLRAAIEIYEYLKLNEIRLIPCNQPPHRANPIANAEQRLRMTKLATLGTELKVDNCEMLREGPSYTVDSLISLRKEFPNDALCLIIGVDAFLSLPSWHQWEKIIQLANIVVMHRNQWKMPTEGILAEFLSKHRLSLNENINHFMAGKIIQCPITALAIAASQIRTLIQNGLSPDFLLPEKVLNYIKQQGLYGYPKGHFYAEPKEITHL